jgi:hypothetical protein
MTSSVAKRVVRSDAPLTAPCLRVFRANQTHRCLVSCLAVALCKILFIARGDNVAGTRWRIRTVICCRRDDDGDDDEKRHTDIKLLLTDHEINRVGCSGAVRGCVRRSRGVLIDVSG